MTDYVAKLKEAMGLAMRIRPKVGGFPYLAETLRAAGVKKNLWTLPACQSLYVFEGASVSVQNPPVSSGFETVPAFDREALIACLRADQEGRSVFPEFLTKAWQAGVVSYEVDFEKRFVVYYGARGESYREDYPAVTLPAQ